ncbi:MAG: OmpH family outer membrane protein [Candidatus Zixiibacteriota bacterium]|nr:MAG: OmpH family outer membrane protein [candidate division Zixibacteria bacterium]
MHFGQREVTMRMRLVSVFLVLAALTATASAKELKIAYIHSQKILSDFQEYSEAQRTLDDEQKKWVDQAKKMEEEITRLEGDLESQNLLLSDEKKAERQKLIQDKFMEYQRFQQEVWGETGKLYQRNKELTQPIVDKVNAVITQLGKDGGYDFIFDAAVGNIVYARDEFDITQTVLDDLNK